MAGEEATPVQNADADEPLQTTRQRDAPESRAFDDIERAQKRFRLGQGRKSGTVGQGGPVLWIHPQRREVLLKPDAPFRLEPGGAFEGDMESIQARQEATVGHAVDGTVLNRRQRRMLMESLMDLMRRGAQCITHGIRGAMGDPYGCSCTSVCRMVRGRGAYEKHVFPASAKFTAIQ